MGKRTAQDDTIIDITSDNQVNIHFQYIWSPASLTFNTYFYLFLYLYITRITINNNTPHLKSSKNQNRRATLGRPAMELPGWGGGKGFNRFAVDQPSSLVLLGSSYTYIISRIQNYTSNAVDPSSAAHREMSPQDLRCWQIQIISLFCAFNVNY